MRIAIFENIMTDGGNEIEFNRILVDELKNIGHEVFFYVPENFTFRLDYKVPVNKIKGDSISYTNSGGIKKIFASIKREINRRRWYSQLLNAQNNFDALIIPTATYRYLRTLNNSELKKISVPLIFVFHGINPNEAPNFIKESEKLLPNSNIKMLVISLASDIFGKTLKNIYNVLPPVFIPRDLKFESVKNPPEVLTIGFFGQYRREKKIQDLLAAFVKGNYTRKVKLLVQGATMHKEDAEEFERIIKPYEESENISVLRGALIGKDWQRAIINVDALLLPYSAPRFKYHWGGMLFTALGYEKPVVSSDDMNPEIFSKYNIGETFKSGNLEDLTLKLENFINNFDKNFPAYQNNLKTLHEKFSPNNFAKSLESVILEK